MNYTVRIKDNSTGEIRKCKIDLEWTESSVFWWTDGNFGCDCNREVQFMRATDKSFDFDDDVRTVCGHTRFTAIDATLEDGSVMKIDGDK